MNPSSANHSPDPSVRVTDTAPLRHLFRRARRLFTPTLWFIGLTLPAAAALVVENHGFTGLDLTPPDGDAGGVVEVRTLNSSIAQLTDVNVSLTLASSGPGQAYNGDYYAYLAHDTGFSVLLNRVGRRVDGSDPSAAFGYGDNGFQVTLDDQAANGDIHNYRFTLSTPQNHLTPIDSQYSLALTGSWQPDGRSIDPAEVLASDSRTAPLSVFNGLNASGQWRLFVADLSGNGTAKLTGWNLTLTGLTTPIPEPATWTVLAATALLAFGTLRRRRGPGAKSPKPPAPQR